MFVPYNWVYVYTGGEAVVPKFLFVTVSSFKRKCLASFPGISKKKKKQ